MQRKIKMKNYLLYEIFLLSLFLTGCNQSNEKLVFAYQDRVVDTLSIIAVERGFVDKNVDSRIFSSGSQTIEALISGSADVASMGDSAAILLLSKYDDFVIIASQGNGSKRHRIIVANGITVNNWTDLKNKKIEMKKGTSTHGGFILKSNEEGVQLSENIIDMNPSIQLIALATGEIDVMVASEPSPSIAESNNIGYFFSSLDI